MPISSNPGFFKSQNMHKVGPSLLLNPHENIYVPSDNIQPKVNSLTKQAWQNATLKMGPSKNVPKMFCQSFGSIWKCFQSYCEHPKKKHFFNLESKIVHTAGRKYVTYKLFVISYIVLHNQLPNFSCSKQKYGKYGKTNFLLWQTNVL